MKMINYSLLFGLLIVAVVDGEVFTVGDEGGWNMQVNYGSWLDKQGNFTVGDVLEFKYTKSDHNVYEVTRQVFQSCNTSNGEVLAKYQSGDDQIQLREARKYWFICQVDGHCLGGMRLAIGVDPPTVTAAAGNDGHGGGVSSGYKDVYTCTRCLGYLVLVLACIWKW
ncbi:unnamed protein product [Linum perenne]